MTDLPPHRETPESAETPDSGQAEPLVSELWPYLLVFLGVLATTVVAWQPVMAGVWHDDGVYMLVGKAIAGGHGFTYDGVVGSPPAAKFPPVYPTVLAALWFVLGSIGPVTLAAAALNVLCVAGAAALFAKALRDAARLSVSMAAITSGLAFVSTDLIRTALIPLSDSLFLLLVAGAFVLWTPASRLEGKRHRLALAAILVAAVLTRSAGLAFVLAFAISLWPRVGFARTALSTGPAIAASVMWGLWSGARAAEIPEGTRDLLGPYGSWLADQTLQAPGAFLSALPAHVAGTLERAAVLLLPGLGGGWLWLCAVPLMACAGVGIVRALRTFPPLGWVVPGYFAMLLLWPYLDRRLLVPIHPGLVAVCVLGAVAIRHGARERRWAVAAMSVGAVAWLLLYSSVTATRIASDWPGAPYRLRAERLAAGVVALQQTVRPDAVVGAAEYWAALNLHGGWLVAPSVRFDPRSVDPEAPMWGTADEQISLWREAGLDHLLLEQGGTLHGAALDQIEEGCPGSVFVLARSPPLMVVRIVWDVCG